jgi:hypothetical protein
MTVPACCVMAVGLAYGGTGKCSEPSNARGFGSNLLGHSQLQPAAPTGPGVRVIGPTRCSMSVL